MATESHHPIPNSNKYRKGETMMKSFSQYLQEHVLSIGLNPDHEKFREKHRHAIHNIIRDSYKDIGGYGGQGHGTKDESDAIHADINDSAIKAVVRQGKVTAATLYKNKHGRKNVALGSDGTDQGKRDVKKTSLEDIEKKRAWGEYSGNAEKMKRAQGAPIVHPKHAEKLTGKKATPVDSEYYKREIGGHEHKKIMLGHPKVSS